MVLILYDNTFRALFGGHSPTMNNTFFIIFISLSPFGLSIFTDTWFGDLRFPKTMTVFEWIFIDSQNDEWHTRSTWMENDLLNKKSMT